MAILQPYKKTSKSFMVWKLVSFTDSKKSIKKIKDVSKEQRGVIQSLKKYSKLSGRPFLLGELKHDGSIKYHGSKLLWHLHEFKSSHSRRQSIHSKIYWRCWKHRHLFVKLDIRQVGRQAYSSVWAASAGWRHRLKSKFLTAQDVKLSCCSIIKLSPRSKSIISLALWPSILTRRR